MANELAAVDKRAKEIMKDLRKTNRSENRGEFLYVWIFPLMVVPPVTLLAGGLTAAAVVANISPTMMIVFLTLITAAWAGVVGLTIGFNLDEVVPDRRTAYRKMKAENNA